MTSLTSRFPQDVAIVISDMWICMSVGAGIAPSKHQIIILSRRLREDT